MQKKLKAIFIFAFTLLCLNLPLMGVEAVSLLKSEVIDKMRVQDDNFQSSAGYAETTDASAAEIVAAVIMMFISLLGIIFVVLIVYSGYNWMTAGGDQSKITKAKDTISRALIGLIIILAAYSITYFVFSSLDPVVSNQ